MYVLAENPSRSTGNNQGGLFYRNAGILAALIIAGAVCSHNMLKQMLQSGERSSP